MSMVLFLGVHVYGLHRAGSLSTTALLTWVTGLVLYVVSIVLSRLYTGMHGFMDVTVGTMLGIIGWVVQHVVMPDVEWWVLTSGWSGNVVFV
jgi:membrane-associated phospholipid phosphatase